MTLRGNKGEWSELYTLLKLLGDGCIYCGDSALNQRLDLAYPILKAFRSDRPDRVSYTISSERSRVEIEGPNFSTEVSQHTFAVQAETLLEMIKSIDTAHFDELDPFLDAIGVDSVKARSTDKADIRLVIHNIHTGAYPELGYSIKSRLGAPSTLINSNVDGTNFLYQTSPMPSDEEIAHFNSLRNFKDKFRYLDQIGAEVSFRRVCSDTLSNNLMMLDLGLEQIVAYMLYLYYRGEGRTIEELTRRVVLDNPLHLRGVTNQPIYQYKVKQFLLAFALGMTSSKPWTGRFNANGGYIVVREDGEIVCYHFFDRNELEEYLYFNTRFETPSTSRHQFGKLFRTEEGCALKLNLQIRFM